MSESGSRFAIRPMTLADLPAVTAIERESFPSAWPVSAYRRELEGNNLARYVVVTERLPALPPSPPAHGWRATLRRWFVEPPPVTVERERIAGFMGLWFMVDEVHIVTIASHPELRRQGVGELLLLEAARQARERHADRLTLECRVSNTPALTLYEKFGFARAGLRRQYYTDNGEDAVIMTTPSLDDPEFVAREAAVARGRGRQVTAAEAASTGAGQ